MPERPAVGVIGVGTIGERLGNALLETGYQLTVYDVDESNVRDVADRGAEVAASPAAVGKRATVIFLALPGTPEVEAVMQADDGLLGVLEAGDIVIDTSTTRIRTALDCATACRDRDVRFVSAPLTRGAPVDGLLLMVGGPDPDYEAARPTIETVAAEHVRFPDVETALRFKYANQLRYASHLAVDAEVVAYAEAAGIDPARLNEHLGMGIEERLLTDDFTQGMGGLGGLAIWTKDLGYALDDAGTRHVPLPLAASVHEAYKHGARHARDGEGHKVAIKRYWQSAGE